MSAPVIFLDCGAYSAFTQGGTIDLADYIKFVSRNQRLLLCYLGLDVIPGAEGRREWRAELIERAAVQSYQNQQRMKDAGLTPIPVFHRGESFRWLERYLADGENYIALAPLVWGVYRDDYLRWLADCFLIIGEQSPIKVHVLGVTSLAVLQLHALASVDSRTWFRSGAFGTIPVPIYVNDQPDYSLNPDIVSMTDRSRHSGRIHFDDLIEYDRDRVRLYLTEVGIDLEEARYGHRHRQRVWVRYHQGLEASCGARIFYVTDTGRRLTEVLDHGQARHRLLSYYELKDLPDHALEDYMAGRLRAPTTRQRRPALWSDQYCDERKFALHQYGKEVDAEDAARRATSKLLRVKIRRD